MPTLFFPPPPNRLLVFSCDGSDMTLGIAALVPHWTMESHVVVHLDDRSAWRDIRSDRPATNADIRGCLAALDALLLRGSFYAGAERTFLKNVTLAAPHSGTSAAHSSAVNTNASIQPSGDSSSRDNIVLQVAAMFLSSRVLLSSRLFVPAVGVAVHCSASVAAAASNRSSVQG